MKHTMQSIESICTISNDFLRNTNVGRPLNIQKIQLQELSALKDLVITLYMNLSTIDNHYKDISTHCIKV